jgi:hypothetical protein
LEKISVALGRKAGVERWRRAVSDPAEGSAEEVEAVAPEVNEPVERRRVMLRGMDPGDLP